MAAGGIGTELAFCRPSHPERYRPAKPLGRSHRSVRRAPLAFVRKRCMSVGFDLQQPAETSAWAPR